MSTVNPNVNNTPSAPKAGNTVETLAATNVLGGNYGLPTAEDLDKVTQEITLKAKTSGQDTFVPYQFEGDTEAVKEANRLNAEWAKNPVSRAEFQELADAVQDLADRITKHNVGAPHRI